MPKPFSLRVVAAVMGSTMSADARHLVHVLAASGNGHTGVGWTGQAEIASRMGVSQRHVRDLFAELEQPDASPVRVERRARFRSDGRGRTSDEWTLVLVDGTNGHTVPVSQPSKRHSVPVGGDGLTGTPRTTNRHTTTDQPAQRAGHRSSERSSKGSSERERAQRWTRFPHGYEPTDADRQLARDLGVNLETELAKLRDHEFSKPKRDPAATLRNWLRRAKDFGGNGRTPAHRGPAPVSQHFDPADDAERLGL